MTDWCIDSTDLDLVNKEPKVFHLYSVMMWNWRPLADELHLQSNPFSIRERMLILLQMECFAYELQDNINTINMQKGIKEKHEKEQAASACCIFQLICPINSLDT